MKRFNFLLLLLLLFSLHTFSQSNSSSKTFTRADSLRGTLSPLRACFDVNYYHLDVKVDVDKQYISGSNLIRFTATRDFNKLQVDLFDNFEIQQITFKGRKLNFTTEYDAIFVDFPELIRKGAIEELTVFYSGNPLIAPNAPWDGGFIFTEDSGGAPWVAVACQGLGASSWWPNKDHQSDEVDSMLISITVPRGLQNISNGRLISKEVQADGSTRFNWFVSYPINNYNVTLNIGDFAHFSDTYEGEEGKLSLDYYVLRENLEKAKQHFKDVRTMLKCFEYWFGPYPFYRDGYKLIESPYLGMEHQSAVAYGNKYQKGYQGSDWSKTGLGLSWDYLIIHESGHEWFGNNITAKDFADLWIHEAFTTYSEGLFVECLKGKKAGAAYIKGERSAIKNDGPIIGSYNVNNEGSGDMYFKGANLLHSIRTIINDDDKWRNILKGLNHTFGLKTVTSAEIISYINEKSGRNLTKVFEQYLNHATIPTLEIRRASASTISYRWKADVSNFDMPVKIKLPGKDEWQFIYPASNKARNLNFKGAVSSIQVDTDNFYIDVIK
ncbi:M1 family metallopeptidase [Desertivirga xinjiangensis]|uniref:M1 family metallopeptidase n=1 Tax=Desertivirga xinjiangensis TaxID=539206 RepID=UPI00210B8DD2|nr:M1 family metallopeptidase [Pedobacter xinjiangensis]